MKALTHLPLALLTLLLLAGCNQSAPRPGGYAIFIPGGDDSMMLVDNKNVGVAGAALAQIGNSGALIFGEIRATPQRSAAAESQTPGLFILDSATGTIERGLSREDWLQKLKKAGVQGEPETPRILRPTATPASTSSNAMKPDPSLPDADPRSDLPRCGGHESKSLAAKPNKNNKRYENTNQITRTIPHFHAGGLRFEAPQ